MANDSCGVVDVVLFSALQPIALRIDIMQTLDNASSIHDIDEPFDGPGALKSSTAGQVDIFATDPCNLAPDCALRNHSFSLASKGVYLFVFVLLCVIRCVLITFN